MADIFGMLSELTTTFCRPHKSTIHLKVKLMPHIPIVTIEKGGNL